MIRFIVSDILNQSRSVYLNDPSATRFTDAKLLPHLKTVNKQLETILEENGIQCKNEISVPIKVPAGEVKLSNIPPDMIWPMDMTERLFGSTDLYTPMTPRVWEPNIKPGPELGYWVWRKDEILFKAATTDREVLLYYQRTFYPISVVSDPVWGYAQIYLEAGTAAFAHMFISQNTELAQACKDIAEANLEAIISISVKKSQSMPVRNRGYRPLSSS